MVSDNPVKYIELNAFLKIKGIASTGGRAKLVIREGLIRVNDLVETRNKRKLHIGDVIECSGIKYKVEKELLK